MAICRAKHTYCAMSHDKMQFHVNNNRFIALTSRSLYIFDFIFASHSCLSSTVSATTFFSHRILCVCTITMRSRYFLRYFFFYSAIHKTPINDSHTRLQNQFVWIALQIFFGRVHCLYSSRDHLIEQSISLIQSIYRLQTVTKVNNFF